MRPAPARHRLTSSVSYHPAPLDRPDHPTAMTPSFHADLLDRHLHALLGELEPETLTLLRQHLKWMTLPAGRVLMRQGEAGDAMYLVVSGRLRARQRQDDGQERLIRDMARGEVIGELSLFTDQPRSATIVAVRDSVLVMLDKPAFNDLLARSARLSMLITRQIIHRLQNPMPQSGAVRPVALALMRITEGVDLAPFAQALQSALSTFGRVALVDRIELERALGRPGLADTPAGDLDADRSIGLHLDELEATHDFVLLLADPTPTAWTERCARRCDTALLVADALQPPSLHDIERQCLMSPADGGPARAEVSETLLLLHPADRHCPQGTRHWLDRRPVAGHVHLRHGLQRDLARLARLLSGNAVGLVLAGGGARGFAHLGVYRALHERGIEVDVVGGTSIGAVMAALVACDRPLDEVTNVARRAFSVNPTGDFNLLPLVSLIAGRRLRRTVTDAARALTGQHADLEDLWKTYYCVASNYTQACEQLLQRGPMAKAILASISIPGALPPVLMKGDLLCDGGTFNNFPVDVMRRLGGVGRVYGVDLSLRKALPHDIEEVPGTWALLRDRLRPRAQRRYRLPSLVNYLMNVTVLYSRSRHRHAQQLTDLCFHPPLERVGMLEWSRFDDIVAQGHAHALALLDAPPRPA